MKKLFLIINPRAGVRKANRYLVDVVGIFNAAGYDVTVFVTGAQGDAQRAAQARGGEFDVVVCIGGDGTFNEMVAGLRSGGWDVPMGYIPAGSTNDFASSLHLSRNITQAAGDIVVGQPRELDIGRFNGRYFSYVASFGAFTRASYATSQNVKNTLGHLAYLLAGVREVAAIRATHMRFTMDDGRVFEDDYLFGAITNSTSVAGVLTLDSNLVDMNDGQFEVILIRKPQNLLELNDCILALTTQDYKTPMITFVSTPRMEVEAPAEMDWTLDGERADGAAHCVIETLHSEIRVITNPLSGKGRKRLKG
ncbi:MAG: YegS/Rv2252/BmrU family lipid kinase [Oscillospiraceae bacterium]|nr:YegS/Rv2252/BmrU family lipid kinase [Oscillospiraceae bacterium]